MRPALLLILVAYSLCVGADGNPPAAKPSRRQVSSPAPLTEASNALRAEGSMGASAFCSPPSPRGGTKGGLSSGSPYWIANEGQWPGDFQFKCEVGNTGYYVTPQGMTIDIKEYSPLTSNNTRSCLPARHPVVAPSSLGKNPPDDPGPCFATLKTPIYTKPTKLLLLR